MCWMCERPGGAAADAGGSDTGGAGPLAGPGGVGSLGVVPTTASRATGQSIDGLLARSRWASGALTYSFPEQLAFYGADGDGVTGFTAFAPAQQAFYRRALGLAASVAGVTFTEVSESAGVHAALRVANATSAGTAYAYLPGSGSFSGDSFYRSGYGVSGTSSFAAPRQGDYSGHTVLHELGHQLGLKHGHEAGDWGALPASEDGQAYSVMTYRAAVGGATDYDHAMPGSEPTTYMMNDVSALQYLYGANYAFNGGNTTYAFNPGTGEMTIDGVGQGAATTNTVFATIWDGGGVDTYDLSTYAADVTIDLAPGAWSTFAATQLADLDNLAPGTSRAPGTIANARLFQGNTASLIENAIGGAGDDAIRGNEAANALTGGAGNDRLWGGAGNDLLRGGAGDDLAYGGEGDVGAFDAGSDVIYLGEGRDIANGQGGDDYVYGEAGSDTLYGDTGNDLLSGGDDADRLHGNEGQDRLYGGRGNDVLYGGADADWFVFGEAGLTAGEVDVVADFQRGLDAIYLPASCRAACTAFDGPDGYAYLAIAVGAGTEYVAASGGGASAVLAGVVWY